MVRVFILKSFSGSLLQIFLHFVLPLSFHLQAPIILLPIFLLPHFIVLPPLIVLPPIVLLLPIIPLLLITDTPIAILLPTIIPLIHIGHLFARQRLFDYHQFINISYIPGQGNSWHRLINGNKNHNLVAPVHTKGEYKRDFIKLQGLDKGRNNRHLNCFNIPFSHS